MDSTLMDVAGGGGGLGLLVVVVVVVLGECWRSLTFPNTAAVAGRGGAAKVYLQDGLRGVCRVQH